MIIGAKSDLLELAEITYIKSRTARIFWENGYKTVGAIASASTKDLLPVLLMVSFMQSEIQTEAHSDRRNQGSRG